MVNLTHITPKGSTDTGSTDTGTINTGSNSAGQWSCTEYCATGKVRQVNEDSIMANNREQLWVVADGMGGHDNGDYASQLVTEALGDFRRSNNARTDTSSIDQHLNHCNTHLVKKAALEQKEVIGCTVAALLLHGEQACCIWSGDSRVYRLRDKQLTPLTRDHNLASLSADAELLEQQLSPFTDTFTHGDVLTSAIGGDESLQTEQCCYPLKPGDEFLLCTDGLYKEVSDEEINAILDTGDANNAPIETLAALYMARGARDNVGMIHIFKNTDPVLPRGQPD